MGARKRGRSRLRRFSRTRFARTCRIGGFVASIIAHRGRFPQPPRLGTLDLSQITIFVSIANE